MKRKGTKLKCRRMGSIIRDIIGIAAKVVSHTGRRSVPKKQEKQPNVREFGAQLECLCEENQKSVRLSTWNIQITRNPRQEYNRKADSKLTSRNQVNV